MSTKNDWSKENSQRVNEKLTEMLKAEGIESPQYILSIYTEDYTNVIVERMSIGGWSEVIKHLAENLHESIDEQIAARLKGKDDQDEMKQNVIDKAMKHLFGNK